MFLTLGHYCGSLPHLNITYLNGIKKIGITLQTRAFPCITLIHDLFYPNGSAKIVPTEIFNYLDEIALAHWIMGDGRSKTSGLDLCTDSFTLSDVILLMNVLMIKFDLECTLIQRDKNKKQYRIAIKARSMPKLIKLVKPYISKSMLYKIEQKKAF